ncbi:hypothetical protein P879_00331 [Paragonimus westermani]|uniref:Large ribosomal subunit protein uL30m n=1 Tax=Paragonimus westermani TaxID=34504 RepID=A0A8T0DW03_9TREM|nr:hypothetical protein P879_00331 [Paragonimus westermani]
MLLRSASFSSTVVVLCRRQFHLTFRNTGRARTYESKPLPGSEEHLNPNAWAKRLFDLQKIRSRPPSTSTQTTEPPLLHMVCRVKPIAGVPHYQRAILERHGLGKGTKNHSWIIVKNTPSVNEDLDVIKHLIRIQPIQFPQGLPTPEDNLITCRLLPDGRFLRRHRNAIDGVIVTEAQKGGTESPKSAENDIPLQLFEHNSPGTGYLTRAYLREWHNRKWARFSLFREFFSSNYKYKLNQDGSEYRYSRLWRLDDAMFHAIREQRNADGTFKSPNQNRFDANWSTFPWPKF